MRVGEEEKYPRKLFKRKMLVIIKKASKAKTERQTEKVEKGRPQFVHKVFTYKF